MFLDMCIESALSQTYREIEVIVVDNASTDQTWSICKKWARLDDRVKIFRNDHNIGPVRNWKRCVEIASGTYSKILFSDDLLYPTCVEEMLKSLVHSEDVAFVYCPAFVGKSIVEGKLSYCSYKTNKTIISSKYSSLVMNGRAPVSPGAVLLRTTDLRENLLLGFPTAKYQPFDAHGAGPDVMVLFLTSERYKYVNYISKALVFFRAHRKSFSIANTKNLISDGYNATFCYYLKRNAREYQWGEYVVKLWLRQIISKRTYWSLKKFSLDFEGCGKFNEAIFLNLIVPPVLLSIAIKSLWRRF
jgi:glycosyltransferase involved in cell wall biosynthesis